MKHTTYCVKQSAHSSQILKSKELKYCILNLFQIFPILGYFWTPMVIIGIIAIRDKPNNRDRKNFG